jgi:glycosyltransferase involved in cell wall biosynthesis
VPAVLAQASLICLPSYREGLPKVLLEAAAAARPIVTTDVPGCREVVRDGENGFVVPPRDSARLADAIASVLRDPALARAMGARSRALAEREFGIEKVVQRTLNTYDKLVPPVVGEPITPDAEAQAAPAPATVAREPTRALSSVRPAGAVTLSR